MEKKDLILEFRLKDLNRFSREYKKKKKKKIRREDFLVNMPIFEGPHRNRYWVINFKEQLNL